VAGSTVSGRLRSYSAVDIPMSTFADNVTVRSMDEIVLSLCPTRDVMCSSESLEWLSVVTLVMVGYCKTFCLNS
jgi:hypothetical protein